MLLQSDYEEGAPLPDSMPSAVQQAEAGKQLLPTCLTFVIAALSPTYDTADCLHRIAYPSKQV